MSKQTRYPWLHLMTPQERSDRLDRDFAAQQRKAIREKYRDLVRDSGVNPELAAELEQEELQAEGLPVDTDEDDDEEE